MRRLNIRRFFQPSLYHNTEDLYKELTRYGHTLGLSVTQIDGYNRSLSSDGGFVEDSIPILADLLDRYLAETNPQGNIAKIAEILRREKMLQTIDIEMYASLGRLEFISALSMWFLKRKLDNAITNGEACHGIYLYPVVVSFNDDGESKLHAYYIAFNHAYIAISNRGATSNDRNLDPVNLGVQIFRLKPGAFETLLLMKATLCSKLPALKVDSLLDQLKDHESLVKFKFKPQKVGNCSLANIKSLIKPMLYMLGTADLEESQIVNDYKAFTNWLREHEIKNLIRKYLIATMKKDQFFVRLYADLLLQYITNSQLNANSINYSETYASEQSFRDKTWWWFSRLSREGGRKDIKDLSHESESPERRTKNLLLIFANVGTDPVFNAAFGDNSFTWHMNISHHIEPTELFPQGIEKELIEIKPEELYVDHISIFNKIFFSFKLLSIYIVMWALTTVALIFAPISLGVTLLAGSAYAIYKYINRKPAEVVELQQANDFICPSQSSDLRLNDNTFITSKLYSKGDGVLRMMADTSDTLKSNHHVSLQTQCSEPSRITLGR